MEPGDRLGVTLKVGHRKCMFATELVSLDWGGEEGVAVVRWPEQVHQLRRRVYQRVALRDGVSVPVRLMQVNVSPDAPRRSAGIEMRNLLHGQLIDLSAGGLRVTVQNTTIFTLGSTYRCSFAPRSGRAPIITDALVRHRGTTDDGRPAVGFQFVGLETTPEGCRTLDRLARIVGHFQRARSRMKS